MNEKKYPALRLISGFYRVIAYIVGVLSVIAPLINFLVWAISEIDRDFGPTAWPTAWIAFLLSIGGLFTAAFMMAISEGIMVLIDMEENTRTTATKRYNLKAEENEIKKKDNEVFCPNCGKQCPANSKHCGFCGHEI